jgi:hypothetical protein
MDDMPEELAEPELTVAAPGFDHSLIADDVIAASESSLNSLAQWSTITLVEVNFFNPPPPCHQSYIAS